MASSAGRAADTDGGARYYFLGWPVALAADSAVATQPPDPAVKFNTVIAAAALALLGGCASPSFQPCMLAGACSSITTQAQTLQTPSKPVAALCVGKLAHLPSLPIRIMAVGSSIGDGHRSAAMDNTSFIVKLYADESTAEIVRELRAKGVDATPCSSSTAADMPRLSSMVRDVITDTGGIGWRTQIDVSMSLYLSAERHSPAVWSASFRSGNRTAVTRPDSENVKAYAENVVAELGKSGWLARK